VLVDGRDEAFEAEAPQDARQRRRRDGVVVRRVVRVHWHR